MPENIRRRRFLQLGVTGVAGLAGCSETDDQRDTPSPTTVSSESPIPSEARSDQTPSESTAESPPAIGHDKLIGVQYYAWYWGEEGFGGQFLAGNGGDGWLSATPGTPVLGAYDSRKEEVINQHMRWCLEHGINWWIITTGRPDGPIDRTIRDVVFKADYADRMNFTLLVGFPPEIRTDNGRFDFDDSRAKPSLTRLFRHWADHYITEPNYLRLGDEGRPPLYFWSTMRATGDVTGTFEAARNAIDADPYIIGGPDYFSQPTDIEYYDATFDAVLDYHSYYPDEKFLEDFGRRVVENHQRWRAATREYGLDFIPTVTPGFNHTESPPEFRDERLLPVLERDVDRFRNHCQQLRGFGDHDAIVITSFNEWPEYSAIEPSEEFGMTYLDIVAEELSRSNWESPDVPPYTTLTLEYDRTVEPAAINPDSNDTRDLAIAASTLQCSTSSGELLIDVGGDEGRMFFTEGVYGPEANDGRTWRWFGGDTARTLLVLPASNVSGITFEARAVTDEIGVTVRAEDEPLGTVSVTDTWRSYST